jgi:tetratricopeptide (TPR) repeat protein
MRLKRMVEDSHDMDTTSHEPDPTADFSSELTSESADSSPSASAEGPDAEWTEVASADSAEDSDADPVSPARKRDWLATGLFASVAVLLVAIVALGVMVFYVMPKRAEAPSTAAQAAIDRANKGVEAKPNDVYARLVLADAYYQHQLWDQALGALDQARSLEPTGGLLAYVEVGYARTYERMGDTDSAEKHYTDSVKLQETFDALYALGNIAAARGDDTQAVDFWLRAMKITPGAATLRLDIAKIYEKQKKYDLALAQIQEAARYLGDDPEVAEAIKRVTPLAEQMTK